MKAIIEDLNRKTDNRFVYAIGIFCLMSICMSQFPEAQKDEKSEKIEIIMASNFSETPNVESTLYRK